MRRSLFDRIFSYAGSDKVLPAENLATEITAYLLEHWQPFRSCFLRGVGIDDGRPNWTVQTQYRLYAPKHVWHGKIPDLLLRSSDGEILILVEVKIDAGVTFDGEASQTQLYRAYLDYQIERRQVQHAKLVTLTRWKPDEALRAPSHVSIRFGDVARWLAESIAASKGTADPVVHLAAEWLRFLEQKRWTMPHISKAHVDAIRCMGELTAELWDILGAAHETVVLAGSAWKPLPRGKSSTSKLFDGSVLWQSAITLGDNPNAAAQMGFFYGNLRGETALFPLVLFFSGLELQGPLDLLEMVQPYSSAAKMVCFPNLVPSVHAGECAQKVMDEAKDQLTSVFPYLQLSSNSDSQSAEQPPLEPGSLPLI